MVFYRKCDQKRIVQIRSVAACARKTFAHKYKLFRPFEGKNFKSDGLAARTVEFWSGGQQLSSGKTCHLQRIMTLEPEGFSRHLLYHTSNNKQRAKNVRHKFSGRSINEFWGQLNTVRKNAEAAIHYRP